MIATLAKEMIHKSCSMEFQASEFMSSKCEQAEETLVVGEEIIVGENTDINQDITEDNSEKLKEEILYFGEHLYPIVEMGDHCVKHCSSTTESDDNTMKEKWSGNDIKNHSFMISDIETRETECDHDESTNDEEEGDEEETIATFVTATGQQLALYAVEDSEEIFAVAVYDESGDPPTNFQFLMKADVERLIGEGAVRTVKKPMQIKKQLLTTEPPLFFSNDSINAQTLNSVSKVMLEESYRTKQKHCDWEHTTNALQDCNTPLEIKASSSMLCTTTDDSEDSQEGINCQNEIIEQSTVQYILFDGDQSDSELTFDEIQATLQKLKNAQSKPLSKKSIKDQNNSNRFMVVDSNINHFENIKPHYLSMGSPTSSEDCEYNVHENESHRFKYTSTGLIDRKQKLVDDQQDLLDTLTNSLPNITTDVAKANLKNGSLECKEIRSAQTSYKTKRSRKQQLVSVNRDDSEIIIQPASLLNDDENNIRKKGKRRRRVISHLGYHQKNYESKKLKKMKHREVEIIEIDVDEEETMYQGKREVVEITIDDSKDKYSSDKENEIIMVGDSDDDTEKSGVKQTLLLQCEHCSRNFRQQRALDTHIRVCSKSPMNVVKLNAQGLKPADGINNDPIKKQYACKICQEKFDVVVALARHVRSEHSQKKKHRRSKSLVSEESKQPFPTNTIKNQITTLRRTRKKKSPHSSCTSWEVKKLNCMDCGRWFPSETLLNAHCLQHGTKKSEQQIRRCQICKKFIKSRLLFIQHLKMHSNAKAATSTLEKKIRTTRQVTRKITALRKRGRPRKL